MSLIEQALRRMRNSEVAGSPVKPGSHDQRTDGVEPERSDWAFARYVDRQPEAPESAAAESPGRIVQVSLDALRAAGLVPPEAFERRIAGQFRQVKLPIVNRVRPADPDFDPQASLVMVASSLSGEGKTFCSVNLALSIARERDTEVLLVDADVAKPNITTAFGLSEEPGLMECLTNESLDVESMVLSTSIEGLQVLPAGKFEEDSATELLSSARMKQVLARLALRGRRRRIVLLDTSPILLTTESRVLAGLVGQIVFVVGADSTPRDAVYEALQSIGMERPVGFILNRSSFRGGSGTSSYYGYGGYGHYGQYGRYGTSLAAEARETEETGRPQ